MTELFWASKRRVFRIGSRQIDCSATYGELYIVEFLSGQKMTENVSCDVWDSLTERESRTRLGSRHVESSVVRDREQRSAMAELRTLPPRSTHPC